MGILRERLFKLRFSHCVFSVCVDESDLEGVSNRGVCYDQCDCCWRLEGWTALW